jgi:hypothetical protein
MIEKLCAACLRSVRTAIAESDKVFEDYIGTEIELVLRPELCEYEEFHL